MANEAKKNDAIKLEYPIQIDGVKVTELNMRRASIGDQIAARHNSKDDIEAEVTLLANLCGFKPADMHQLDLKDYKTCQKRYEGFLK